MIKDEKMELNIFKSNVKIQLNQKNAIKPLRALKGK